MTREVWELNFTKLRSIWMTMMCRLTRIRILEKRPKFYSINSKTSSSRNCPIFLRGEWLRQLKTWWIVIWLRKVKVLKSKSCPHGSTQRWLATQWSWTMWSLSLSMAASSAVQTATSIKAIFLSRSWLIYPFILNLSSSSTSMMRRVINNLVMGKLLLRWLRYTPR